MWSASRSSTCTSDGRHCTSSWRGRSASACGGVHHTCSCSDRSTCASGGVHRTSPCRVRNTMVVEYIAPAPARPVDENVAPATPNHAWQRLQLSMPRQSVAECIVSAVYVLPMPNTGTPGRVHRASACVGRVRREWPNTSRQRLPHRSPVPVVEYIEAAPAVLKSPVSRCQVHRAPAVSDLPALVLEDHRIGCTASLHHHNSIRHAVLQGRNGVRRGESSQKRFKESCAQVLSFIEGSKEPD